MSQEIDLRKDSGDDGDDDDDDDGEGPNTASVPPLSLTRKRPRHEDVGSEDAQVLVDHREAHEGIAAAASHPMTLDSELTSRNDESADMYSQKQSTLKPPSNSSGRQSRVTYWEDRLSELADYRKSHRHCNAPINYSENAKLANWVKTQRLHYRLHKEGKTSPMTTFRIQELESLGFEWGVITTWEDRLSELADYRKIHGHCNVPKNYSENAKLGRWVTTQKSQYRLHNEGKTSPMTTFRIQELESLDFEWGVCITAWEDRLSELADYRKSHRHCNVPVNYSENAKLGKWVAHQRVYYRLHKEGKTSPMTTFRIQELESLGFECENAKLGSWVGTQRVNYRLHKEGKTSPMTTFRIEELECLGFEWGVCITAWEARLSELTDYRKIHGHCNVPFKYSENAKLSCWVKTQRTNYRLHLEGKTSSMTLSRIQELECLDFKWKARIGRKNGKPSLDDDATRVRERAVEAPEHVQTTSQTQEDFSGRESRTRSIQVDVTLEPEESDWNGEDHLIYIPGRTEDI